MVRLQLYCCWRSYHHWESIRGHMCINECVDVFICTCIHTYIHPYIHISIYSHIHIYIYTPTNLEVCVCVCVCVFCWYPMGATWSSADPCITADALAALLLNQLACAGGLMGFRGNREHFRMAFFTPAHPPHTGASQPPCS